MCKNKQYRTTRPSPIRKIDPMRKMRIAKDHTAGDETAEGSLARARVWGGIMTRRKAPARHIDWFQVITALSRKGYSMQALADELMVARTTLIGWRQGAEPPHSGGDRLLILWSHATGLERRQAPTVTIDDWWAYHSK